MMKQPNISDVNVDLVWDQIDTELDKKRRRRFFFLFFFPMALLGLAALWMWGGNTNAAAPQAQHPTVAIPTHASATDTHPHHASAPAAAGSTTAISTNSTASSADFTPVPSSSTTPASTHVQTANPTPSKTMAYPSSTNPSPQTSTAFTHSAIPSSPPTSPTTRFAAVPATPTSPKAQIPPHSRSALSLVALPGKHKQRLSISRPIIDPDLPFLLPEEQHMHQSLYLASRFSQAAWQFNSSDEAWAQQLSQHSTPWLDFDIEGGVERAISTHWDLAVDLSYQQSVQRFSASESDTSVYQIMHEQAFVASDGSHYAGLVDSVVVNTTNYDVRNRLHAWSLPLRLTYNLRMASGHTWRLGLGTALPLWQRITGYTHMSDGQIQSLESATVDYARWVPTYALGSVSYRRQLFDRVSIALGGHYRYAFADRLRVRDGGEALGVRSSAWGLSTQLSYAF